MAQKKRTTRTSPATTTSLTTPVTDAQLRELISQGVDDALAKGDTDRSRNSDESHDSGTGGRRQVSTVRECTYIDFLKMFPKELDEVEKYVGGLPDMIRRSVKISKHKTMQEEIKSATELMDQKILTLKPYGGSKPLWPKCNYHHDGPCAPKCTNCKRIGHSARDCKSQPTTTNNNQRAQRANQRVLTCFEYGAKGHFKNDYLKLRNKNQENQVGNDNAVARAYVVGTARTNSNSNVVTGTFLLNNRYASILFDIGAARSFVSTAFSSLIDIIPTTLDHGYDVELAYGRIIWQQQTRVSIKHHLMHQNIKVFVDGTSHLFGTCYHKKKGEDKSKEKRIKDVTIVQNFPEVFPEDLPGIPPTHQVEFEIDLIPGATLVA
uniref:CCHC-type domain-containing protein n=1 Tax=Tanacetum cinerariifolium TaxID=118510 RepID=A0A699KXY8_TANCI|nr:hypothetical protein [Tanacetum cinerariifolium]